MLYFFIHTNILTSFLLKVVFSPDVKNERDVQSSIKYEDSKLPNFGGRNIKMFFVTLPTFFNPPGSQIITDYLKIDHTIHALKSKIYLPPTSLTVPKEAPKLIYSLTNVQKICSSLIERSFLWFKM